MWWFSEYPILFWLPPRGFELHVSTRSWKWLLGIRYFWQLTSHWRASSLMSLMVTTQVKRSDSRPLLLRHGLHATFFSDADLSTFFCSIVTWFGRATGWKMTQIALPSPVLMVTNYICEFNNLIGLHCGLRREGNKSIHTIIDIRTSYKALVVRSSNIYDAHEVY